MFFIPPAPSERFHHACLEFERLSFHGLKAQTFSKNIWHAHGRQILLPSYHKHCHTHFGICPWRKRCMRFKKFNWADPALRQAAVDYYDTFPPCPCSLSTHPHTGLQAAFFFRVHMPHRSPRQLTNSEQQVTTKTITTTTYI